ncbi:MAG: family 10 glycosylhydrolase [Thermoplasmatota archaeon]
MRNKGSSFILPPIIMLCILTLSLSSNVLGSTGSDEIAVSRELTLNSGYGQQDGGNNTRLFQLRSMWLDGYEIVNISEIRNVVAYARDHNFNCLSPLINGNYYGVFYKSEYLPMHPDVAPGFDPLLELIKEANKYGIQVHPWWHTVYNRPMVSRHPEWACISSGGYINPYWLNPALPQVKSMITNMTLEVVRNYPVGGIKLDTIRYPGSSYSYDTYSIAKFYEEGGGDFSAWRRKQITNLVDMIYGEIMETRPYIWVGADVWQYYSSWYNGVFQDGRDWAGRGIIDYLTMMGYTTSIPTYVSNLNDYLQNSHDAPIIGGPYVYVPGNYAHGSVPNETVGINTMLAQVEATLDSTALGTCLFSYKFLRDWPAYGRALAEGPFSEYAYCPMKNQTHAVSGHKWEFNREADREGWRLTDSGHHFPADGQWTIAKSKNPGIMSPLLNITSEGINVIEINAKIDSEEGSMDVYWSKDLTTFGEDKKIRIDLAGVKEWRIASIHLDRHPEWSGKIRYIKVVPRFPEESNITMDFIRLSWTPDCVRTWASAGTFTMGHSENLIDRRFIENENTLIPSLGDVSGGRVWVNTSTERDLIDLDLVYGSWEYSAAYSHVFVKSGEDMTVQMRVGSSDGIKVWVNGDEILRNSEERDIGPDLNITDVSLNKGLNSVLVKLVVYRNDLSFYLRFTTSDNRTLDGLEYYNDIPPLIDPAPVGDTEGWHPYDTANITWDPTETVSVITGYEWRIDGGGIQSVETERIRLTGLDEGIHRIEVRSVDEFETRSGFGLCEVMMDWSKPRISTPDTGTEIVDDDSITWKWEDLFIPASGIREYRVTITYEGMSGYYSGILSEDRKVNKRSVTLENGIYDGYIYHITVTAVSNAGYSSEIIGKPVLVDRKAPFPPSDTKLTDTPEHGLSYNLSWNASFDDFGSGIDHYEVWSLEGASWNKIHETPGNWCSVERVHGRGLRLKVRAVDRAGHIGLFSEEIESVNLPPAAVIKGWTYTSKGEYIIFTSSDSYDPDGIIDRIVWSFQGINISDLDSITLTLTPGSYNLTLWVEDDLSTISSVSLELKISEGDAKALANWLTEISTADVSLPPIYNISVTRKIVNSTDGNITAIPETRDEEIPSESVIIEGAAVGITVVFTILVISAILFLLITSRRDSATAVGADEPETKTYSNRVGWRINAGRSNLISVMKLKASGRNLAGDLMKSYIPTNTEYRMNRGTIDSGVKIAMDPVDDLMELDEDMIIEEDEEEDYILPDLNAGEDFSLEMVDIPVVEEPDIEDIEDWEEFDDYDEISEFEDIEDWEEADDDIDWTDEEES